MGCSITESTCTTPTTAAYRLPHKKVKVLEPARKHLTGQLDVTFLVASDTHLGYLAPSKRSAPPLKRPVGIEKTNLRMIDDMNRISGRSFPSSLGGLVQRPRGLLVSGDLTEHGGRDEWELWNIFFGLHGTESPIKLPVFEGAGNHDRVKNWHIRDHIKKRHGSRHYYFDWDDLRIVCLGEAPDDSALELLREAMTTAEENIPFVLYFHYPLKGPYSDNNWFGRGDGRERFRRALEGRRIVGIFHGHYHATGAYRWHGYDVYNVGSPKYVHHSYSIVHITQDSMTVAEWNYDRKNYSWWHQKPLHDASGVKESVGVDSKLTPPPAFSIAPR